MKKSIGTLEIIIVLLGLNLITNGTAAPAKKCTQVKTGGYYDGMTSPRIDDVKTSDDCKNLCENDAICYGWQYQSSSSSCWLQTTIGVFYTDASYMGGACIGPDAKAPCKEKISKMYYNGDSGPAIKNVAKVEDCMAKCDADSTCLGWSYSSSSTTCWTQTTVYGSVSSSQYMGGSCIKKQTPYPAITIDDFRKQALQKINGCRRKHTSPDLKLDDELNTIAQTYAEKIANLDELVHSDNKYHGDYMGENIYNMCGVTQPLYTLGTDPVASWYSEKDSYNWSNPGFNPSTGHFTQVVWKNTTLLGVGRAVSKSGCLYVVSNYYPGGNSGKYAENVPKPTS